MYIERQLEKKFTAVSEEYACVLLTGPRQVGKSTMLRHLMEGTARAEVSLDDLEERRLAKTDPAMFLKLHRRRFSSMRFSMPRSCFRVSRSPWITAPPPAPIG